MRRLISIIAIMTFVLFPTLALAELDTGLVDTAQEAGYVGEQDPPTVTSFIATIVNVVLGLTGIALLILFIYGGIRWMTAMGDKGAVETAKKVLTNAIIGIIIVIAAYAIANYLIVALIEAAT
jgi:hypothetical protein